MNNPATGNWSPMISNPDDEFSSFLDFGELNFSAFDSAATTEAIDSALQQDGEGPMDTMMAGSGGLFGLEQAHLEQQQQADVSAQIPAIGEFYQEPFDIEAQLFHQQRQRQIQLQQHRYRAPNVVPPTPNSIEMHGGQVHYYQPRMDQQQQQMYEQYRRHQKDQVNFTPLVSPAVTPLDMHFNKYHDYAASTESFSPLTSPALRAQNQAARNSAYGAVRGSDTSDTTSPVDPNLEYNAPTSGSNPRSWRKSRRKASSSSTKNPARAVRESPAMKPQSRRKQPSSTVIPPKEVAGIIEQARRNQEAGNKSITSDGKLPLTYNQDSSEADSVSPEPLPDILMPPPATPRSNSAGRSPCLSAKQGGVQANEEQTDEPATPASLMRLRKQAEKANGGQYESSHLKQQAILAEVDMERITKDNTLPRPAGSGAKKPTLQSIDTTHVYAGQATPTVSTRKTRLNCPGSTPVTAPGSVFSSPQASIIASPTDTAVGKRSDPKVKSRETKKRNNTNSEKVSPALRPRISPSIKPLLPEGGKLTACPKKSVLFQVITRLLLTPVAASVSPETSALLLASKSNYQNILEGTHFPGLSYPETLSTDLTSKRTSHKIAEQGRRNRINTALHEIASLLPPQNPPPLANGNDGESMTNTAMMTSGTAQQQSNSKASTVEAAIEYIKSLQKEVKECKEKLAGYENETEDRSQLLKVDMSASKGPETVAA
ncbi:MAG: hypothetical protein Q9163_005306 [Psora crenata]